MWRGPKWQFHIGYHSASAPGRGVLPQLLRVYNYAHSHSALLQKTISRWCLYWILLKILTQLAFMKKQCCSITATGQTLSRILPNCHLGPMYRHYVTWISDNFGPRQISVIAIRGTFAFWHTDISSFQRKLAESAWDQNLRREWCVASAPEVSEEQKGQNTSST